MKLITTRQESMEAAIFLLNKRFDNLKEHKTEKYPNRIFYYNPDNKEILMIQNLRNKDLWVNYDEVWSFLEMLFDYDYKETQKVIKIWVEKSYNLKDVTPGDDRLLPPCLAKEVYNLNKIIK